MKYRPLELRMKLYSEVRRLLGQGLSYREIIIEIEKVYRVTLSKSHISYWTRGIYNPYNGRQYIPSIDYLSPSEELAYIIGAIAGDGYVKQISRRYKGYNEVFIGLEACDRDFAEEFSRCIGKVLGRKPPKPRTRKNGKLVVEVKSKTLYELLKKPINIDRIRKYVEHCIRCICAFLRGFFDGEGSIDKDGRIRVYNTDKSLLEYIKDLLNRLGIKTTEPKISIKAGTLMNYPRTNRTYYRRKDTYYLYVYAESRLRFYQLIGFTIKRKQQRLEEYLIRRGI